MFCLTVNESIFETRAHWASKPSSLNRKLFAVQTFCLSKPTGEPIALALLETPLDRGAGAHQTALLSWPSSQEHQLLDQRRRTRDAHAPCGKSAATIAPVLRETFLRRVSDPRVEQLDIDV
jgi:hypothetical protein